MTSPSRTTRSAQRSDAEQVLKVLNDFCLSLQPGDIVPTYQELMRRCGASERSVRWALDELRREGKIVRRQGARTYVADTRSESDKPLNGSNTTYSTTSMESVGAEMRTIIAVAIPDHALFDQAIKLLVEQAKIEELSVICHVLPDVVSNASELPQVTQKPLGFILFRRELLPLAEELHADGHRVVLLGTPYADATPAVPVVYGDQEHGGYLATKHLIALGHRRLGFCAFTDCEKTLRWQGHRRAIREVQKRGVEVEDCVLDLEQIRTWKDEPSRGEAVFRSPVAPTGLVVWNDHEAAMVMGQLNRLGLRVPHDVSIVGYDNLREGQNLHPALTTVHSPIEQQLQAAINLLRRPIVPPMSYQLVVLPNLICRDSTANISI